MSVPVLTAGSGAPQAGPCLSARPGVYPPPSAQGAGRGRSCSILLCFLCAQHGAPTQQVLYQHLLNRPER